MARTQLIDDITIVITLKPCDVTVDEVRQIVEEAQRRFNLDLLLQVGRGVFPYVNLVGRGVFPYYVNLNAESVPGSDRVMLRVVSEKRVSFAVQETLVRQVRATARHLDTRWLKGARRKQFTVRVADTTGVAS